MANANNPFGFEVLKTEGKECRAKSYAKSASIIYMGDALKLVAAGTVEVAAAGDRIIGVAAEYKAAADASVLVYDDPEAVFYAQVSGDFAAADVGQNANIVANAGNATLKQSNHTLDSTFATTATHQFKLLGLLERGENAVGSYALVKVKPNSHEFKAGTSGV